MASINPSQASSPDESKEKSNVQVCLRFRPMNKFEISRRSNNCVEIHDNKSLTVDSPLQGSFDFKLDSVLDENASQTDVYEKTISSMPAQLLEGFNCTVIAYGQTGSGKTHTMMGEETVAKDADERSERSISGSTLTSMSSIGSAKAGTESDAEDGDGMIQKIVEALFDLIEQSSPSIEYVIRCSYVEIYLERMIDLLNPSASGVCIGTENDDGSIEPGNSTSPSRVVGASELCCFDKSNVLSILARGNRCRTACHDNMHTDSSRSNAIFILTIEQKDKATGKMKKSVLQMADLAGSEMASKGGDRGSLNSQAGPSGNGMVLAEIRMLNKSLYVLSNTVRSLAKGDKEVPGNQSKLTHLLRPSFGGNSKTTIILTASPSSYNIGETISTIRFGKACSCIKNDPVANSFCSPEEYENKLALLQTEYETERSQTQTKEAELKNLMQKLAKECQSLKDHGGQPSPEEESLWESIGNIVKDDGNLDDIAVTSKPSDLEYAEAKIRKLEEELKSSEKARARAEISFTEMQSDFAMMQGENEKLKSERNEALDDLVTVQGEVDGLKQLITELETRLQKSRVKESEATVFLRQFRRFYQRVLQHAGSNGSGSAKHIMNKVPGVPEMNDLIDIDALLVDGGMLGNEEANDAPDDSPDLSSHKDDLERDLLQRELLQVTDQCIELQILLKEKESEKEKISLEGNSKEEMEKKNNQDMNSSLTNRSIRRLVGSLTDDKSRHPFALNKRELNEQFIRLRRELDVKNHDMQAIVWKMNELHTVNKAYNEKLIIREEHVKYLENNIDEMQSTTKRLRQERKEQLLRNLKEMEKLKAVLREMSLPVWQFGEKEIEKRNLASRIILPFAGGKHIHQEFKTAERRLSEGDTESDDPPS